MLNATQKLKWGTMIIDVLSVIIYLTQQFVFIITMQVGMVYQKTGSLHKTSHILLLVFLMQTLIIDFLFLYIF